MSVKKLLKGQVHNRYNNTIITRIERHENNNNNNNKKKANKYDNNNANNK